MIIHRKESIVRLACVTAAAFLSTVHAQTTGGVAVAVPVDESLAPNQAFASPAEWSLSARAVIGDRVVAMRYSTFGNAPPYLVEVRRDASGEWMPPQPMSIAGLPALQVFFGTLPSDGRTTFLCRAAGSAGVSGDTEVIRRSGDGWERLPPFPRALGLPRVLGSKEFLLWVSSPNFVRTFALVGGEWVQTRSIDVASLGLQSGGGGAEVGGGVVVVQGTADPAAWGVSAGSVRCVVLDLLDADAEPVRVPADAAVQQCVITASGEGVLAVRDSAIGIARQTQRVLERGSEGALAERLRWFSDGSEGSPTNIGPGGSLAGNRWIRPRNAAGGWNPALWFGGSTVHRLMPIGADGDVLAQSNDGSGSGVIMVFDAPWDLDGNGVRDGDEIASGAAADCNRNGSPDPADIAAGRLADADGDGVPDRCIEDCDANGIADLGELRDGAAADCETGGLARCAIAAGATDSNGDGVADRCSPDRDRNGIPDDVELAGGALDCDANGIPNGMPVAGIVPEGLSSPENIQRWTVSWASSTGMVLCATYFPLTEPLRLDALRFHVNVGTDPTQVGSPVGRPYHVFVNQALSTAALLSQSEVVWTATGAYRNADFQSVSTPPIVLHPPGFFVSYTAPAGAFAPSGSSVPQEARPAIRAIVASEAPDGNPRHGRGWVAATSSSTQTARQLLDAAVRWGWMPDIEVVANGCPLDGDFNGDGIVGGGDLGILLGAWGPANGSPCDLNTDGSVDGLDLGILLSNFASRDG